MLARCAVCLHGSATQSRWHFRHRSHRAEEADGARVHGRLVDQLDPVQRVADHDSGEKRTTGKDMGRMRARRGQISRGRGHEIQ